MKKILATLTIVLASALGWAQNPSQGSRAISPKAEQNIAKEVRHEVAPGELRVHVLYEFVHED